MSPFLLQRENKTFLARLSEQAERYEGQRAYAKYTFWATSNALP